MIGEARRFINLLGGFAEQAVQSFGKQNPVQVGRGARREPHDVEAGVRYFIGLWLAFFVEGISDVFISPEEIQQSVLVQGSVYAQAHFLRNISPVAASELVMQQVQGLCIRWQAVVFVLGKQIQMPVQVESCIHRSDAPGLAHHFFRLLVPPIQSGEGIRDMVHQHKLIPPNEQQAPADLRCGAEIFIFQLHNLPQLVSVGRLEIKPGVVEVLYGSGRKVQGKGVAMRMQVKPVAFDISTVNGQAGFPGRYRSRALSFCKCLV